MKQRIISIVLIIFMSVLFFLILDTKHIPPVGALMLESFGLKAWSGGDTGFNLTLIYFGVPFLIAYIELRRQIVIQKRFKPLTAFIIFLVCVTVMNTATGFIVQRMKSGMDDLYTIAYIDESGNIKLDYQDQKLKTLHIEFALKNYDDIAHTFSVSLNSEWFEADRVAPIKILNKEGSDAMFTLQAGEEKLFVIDRENYDIEGGVIGENFGYTSFIEEIILSGDGVEAVKLTHKSIFGKPANQ